MEIMMHFPSGEFLTYSDNSWCKRKSPGEESWSVMSTGPVVVRSSLMENEDMNPTRRRGDCSSWRLD